MSAEVVARVETMWPELGLGARRPASPQYRAGRPGASAVARVLDAARDLLRARP